jgi:hypothetical protein
MHVKQSEISTAQQTPRLNKLSPGPDQKKAFVEDLDMIDDLIGTEAELRLNKDPDWQAFRDFLTILVKAHHYYSTE